MHPIIFVLNEIIIIALAVVGLMQNRQLADVGAYPIAALRIVRFCLTSVLALSAARIIAAALGAPLQ